MQVQSNEEIKRICNFWVDYIMPQEFPHYVDDSYNKALVLRYIKYHCNGVFSAENLSAAVDHHKSNMHGTGVQDSPEVKAAKAKAAAEKIAAEATAKAVAANDKIVALWLENEAPLGLIVDGTLYGSSQDKIVAYFHRNYPGLQVITAQILSEAVLTLGPALDWFDRSPDAMQLRNQPAPPPRLSE